MKHVSLQIYQFLQIKSINIKPIYLLIHLEYPLIHHNKALFPKIVYNLLVCTSKPLHRNHNTFKIKMFILMQSHSLFMVELSCSGEIAEEFVKSTLCHSMLLLYTSVTGERN